MILVQDLRLAPGRRPADAVRLPPGAITLLLGRNLSGKTAFCRALAGLPGQAQCRLTVGGKDMTGRPVQDYPVSMVYQEFVNYPRWTVAQNIASPLRRRRLAAGELRRQVADYAAKVGLEGLLERLPHELSGGQQQRLAIARALAKQPALIVMDEPFANLDFNLREALAQELQRLVSETGVALVYATTLPSDALALADQLVLLDQHEVLQVGRPLDLYRAPASLAAAGLMSDPGVNLLGDGRAVRPEHLSLDDCGGMAFDAEVRAVETSGSETFVHAEVQGASWVARLPGMHQVKAGERRRLHARREDLLAPAAPAADAGSA